MSSQGKAPCRDLWGWASSMSAAGAFPGARLHWAWPWVSGRARTRDVPQAHPLVTRRKNATRPYSSLPGEAVFANGTGMLVVVFGLLVLYILQASSWKRPEVGLTTEGQVRAPGLPGQPGGGLGLESGHQERRGPTRKTNPGTWWGTGSWEVGALVSGQPIPAINGSCSCPGSRAPGAGPPGEMGVTPFPILVASGGKVASCSAGEPWA